MAIYPDASWTHTEDTIGKYFNAVKYSEGGSIWEEVAKAEVNDEPTLIVGIGGLANSTVNQIKEKYIRRINDPQKKIHFMAIDTCRSDLAKLNYLSDSEKFFFDPPASDPYINLIDTVLTESNNKPQIKWCDPNLSTSIQFNGNGADRTRQAGRLYLSIRKCYNDILNKIDDIFKYFNNKFNGTHVRVILIAGVCSGTGSGCIIDISYLINEVAKNVIGGLWQSNISAFIYGPIPSFKDPKDLPSWERSCRHFIATMKEVNNFMSKDTGNQYVFQHENGTASSNDRIFDSCTIVQGYTDDAGVVLNDEQVQKSLEDYVIASLSKTNIEGKNYVSISSAIDGNINTTNEVSYKQVKGDNPNLPTDTGYFYRAVEFKTIHYPIQEIVTLLCDSALRALEDLYTNADRIDAEDYLKDLGLLPKGNPTGATPKYSRLDTTANRYQWFDQFFSNYERTAYTMITKKVQSLLPDRKSASAVKNYAMSVSAELYPFSGNWAENIADTVYSNLVDVLKKNPYQAKFLLQDILHSTNKGIFLWMLNQGTAAKSDLQKIRDASNQVCSEIKNNIGFLGISSDNYNRFRSAAFQVAWADWRIAVWDRMIKEFKEAYEILNNKDSTLFNSLVVLLRSISEIVGKDSSSMLTHDFKSQGNKTNYQPIFHFTEQAGDQPQMSTRLQDLIQYTLKWVDPSNNKTFVDSLGDKLMAQLLAVENIEKLNTSDQTQFMLAIQEVKKVISELLDDSIQKIVTNILIVFYSTKEYNPDLTNSIPVANVLNMLNDPKYINPTIAENINYSGMETDFQSNYHINPFQVAADAIYKEMCSATVCASLTGAGVNPALFKDYQLFSLMNDKLMVPYITDKIIQKIQAKFPYAQINTADSNYTYVHVYAGVPLYAFKGMAEYQTDYAMDTTEKGLHMSMSRDDLIPWESFPPMVNDLALKVIKANGNEYMNDPAYQKEISILQEVTNDANAVDRFGFFEGKIDPTNSHNNYYEMHYLFDYDVVNDAVVQKVLATYKADIANAVNTISANSIPITENDPVAYCTSQIAEKLKTTIYDYLQNAGIKFASRDVKPLNSGFVTSDISYSYEKVATSANNGFGGFYRTLRCSSKAREDMKKIRLICEKIQEQMDAVLKETVPNMTADLLKAFWRNKEQKEIRTFLKALGQNLIQIQVSSLQIVVTNSLTGKVYPFATNRGFEVQYLLYSVYAGWFTQEYRTNDTFRNTLDAALKSFEANPEFNENLIIVKAGETYHNNTDLQDMLKKCGIIAGDASPAKKISDTYNISNEVRSAFFDYNDKKTLEENETIDPLFVNVHLGDSTNFMSDTHVTKAIVRNLIAFYNYVDDIIKNAKLAVPANS